MWPVLTLDRSRAGVPVPSPKSPLRHGNSRSGSRGDRVTLQHTALDTGGDFMILSTINLYHLTLSLYCGGVSVRQAFWTNV